MANPACKHVLMILGLMVALEGAVDANVVVALQHEDVLGQPIAQSATLLLLLHLVFHPNCV